MSTPASNQNETSKMKKLMSGDTDQTGHSIHDKLPRGNHYAVEGPPLSPEPTPVSRPSEPKQRERRLKLLPAFWTIASVLSMIVNLVLIVALLIMLQMFGAMKGMQTYAGNKVTGLLGGLYDNFVKMDRASIRTSIHVEKEIPVQFKLNVSGPTNVTLSQPVTINGALVTVQTGGLNIVNARATIVLPQGQVLPINIENLVVPVDQKVPAVLDVPVDIPLRQTELHEPFVGLQKVVEPWYCLINPGATFDGIKVCSPTTSTTSPVTDPTLLDPALRTPAPAETVIP